MDRTSIITAAIKQVRSHLRATPKAARGAHWQLADRRIKDAALLLGKNDEVAEQRASEALFHVNFVTF